jgi:hypothetical protein
LTYLDPPPAPAPVVVTKDYGGLVTDYQARTEYYRQTDREVRIHECHSACTLALSLPNACVYPDSIFKFHQAYNEINKQTDLGVSEQLFDSYPVAVRARLGTLTRKFKVLTGSELIALGIRDCNTPRIMVARRTSPAPPSTLANVWSNVMTAFGAKATRSPSRSAATTLVATRQQTEQEKHLTDAAVFAGAPLPPPRPQDNKPDQSQGRQIKVAEAAEQTAPVLSGQEQKIPAEKQSARMTEAIPPASSGAPRPPQRPNSLSAKLTQKMPPIVLVKVIDGAQPILPPHFLAYAMIARLSR